MTSCDELQHIIPLSICYCLCFIGKLLSRSHKIAYTLLNRGGAAAAAGGGDASGGHFSGIKAGDRVALVYPNNDPLNFMCAFYGCVMAGMVPVPIEVPITRRVWRRESP